MRQRITASKLALALECQHPWTSGIEWKESRSASSRLGNAIHALAERHVLGQSPSVEGVAIEFSLQPAQLGRLWLMYAKWKDWVAHHDTSTWSVEQAFAVDPATGKVTLLVGAAHRDYSGAAEHEICGTADVVDAGRDALVVRDYKSGVWVDHPSTSAQMRFLGLAASRHHGRSHVTIEIVRTMPDGVHPVPHTLDVLDLAMVDDELHELHRRMQMPSGPTPSATACKWCPIRHECPENFYAERNDDEQVA